MEELEAGYYKQSLELEQEMGEEQIFIVFRQAIASPNHPPRSVLKILGKASCFLHHSPVNATS